MWCENPLHSGDFRMDCAATDNISLLLLSVSKLQKEKLDNVYVFFFMGLTNVTSINEIRCFLYLCIRSITFNIIPSKMFGISIMFSISELHLYFPLSFSHCYTCIYTWFCKNAALQLFLLQVTIKERRRRVGKGKMVWKGVGEAAGIHHLFVRYSLFTLCTIWWIIMGLSNAVPTNLLLLLRVCDICIHSIDHVNTYIHVHMLFIQLFMRLRCKDTWGYENA